MVSSLINLIATSSSDIMARFIHSVIVSYVDKNFKQPTWDSKIIAIL